MLITDPDYITNATELLGTVNEMADGRDVFITKLVDYHKQIAYNFGKIIILKNAANSTLNFHWAGEIAELLLNIWETKLTGDNKSKGKLKKLLLTNWNNKIFSDKHIAKFPGYFKTAIKSETKNTEYIGTYLYDYCCKIYNNKQYDYKVDVDKWLPNMKDAIKSAIEILEPTNTDEEREFLKYKIAQLICRWLSARYE